MRQVIKQHYADWSYKIEGDYIVVDGQVRWYGVLWGTLTFPVLLLKIVAYMINDL